MRGADILAEMLIGYGVEVVFGVPGDTNVPFYEALQLREGRIRHVMARDERSAGYMADAYGRFTKKPGVFECPSGAGAMYSLPPVAESNGSSVPVILLTIDIPLPGEDIHIGPSDFVPFLKDNKVAFIRLEGTGFGGVPLNLELRLSVEDSPNSAGVVIDAIRCCRLALDAGIAGPILPVSAWTMKHPPQQLNDREADRLTDQFIADCLAGSRQS